MYVELRMEKQKILNIEVLCKMIIMAAKRINVIGASECTRVKFLRHRQPVRSRPTTNLYGKWRCKMTGTSKIITRYTNYN